MWLRLLVLGRLLAPVIPGLSSEGHRSRSRSPDDVTRSPMVRRPPEYVSSAPPAYMFRA